MSISCPATALVAGDTVLPPACARLAAGLEAGQPSTTAPRARARRTARGRARGAPRACRPACSRLGGGPAVDDRAAGPRQQHGLRQVQVHLAPVDGVDVAAVE